MSCHAVGMTGFLDFITLNSWIVALAAVSGCVAGYLIFGPRRSDGGGGNDPEPLWDHDSRREETGSDGTEGGGD